MDKTIAFLVASAVILFAAVLTIVFWIGWQETWTLERIRNAWPPFG